ncbi:MAG: YesL family protein [Scrofimicrobium sp.]
MSSSIFNSENAFWQGMTRLADLVVLNFLFVLGLIPIVTGGASFTALYETAGKLLEERGGGVTRTFWASFKSNFGRSTAIWAIVGPLGLGVLAGWFLMPADQILALRVLLTLLYLLMFPYFFFLQARFDNSVAGTLRNSLLIPLTRLPYALAALGVTVILVAVIVGTAVYIPQLLPPLLLCGFGIYAYGVVPVLNKSVEPWTRGAEES